MPSLHPFLIHVQLRWYAEAVLNALSCILGWGLTAWVPYVQNLHLTSVPSLDNFCQFLVVNLIYHVTGASKRVQLKALTRGLATLKKWRTDPAPGGPPHCRLLPQLRLQVWSCPPGASVALLLGLGAGRSSNRMLWPPVPPCRSDSIDFE